MSPREGPSEGGTRLTIRGSCLGRTKVDVVGLYVCGSNVLSSLEFVSSSKLVCTTKCHKPCTGTVVVETQSGGRGVSLVQFTFNDTSVTSSASAAAAGRAGLPVLGSPVLGSPVLGHAISSVGENLSDSTSECSSSLSRSSSRGGDADIKREPSVKVPLYLSSPYSLYICVKVPLYRSSPYSLYIYTLSRKNNATAF